MVPCKDIARSEAIFAIVKETEKLARNDVHLWVPQLPMKVGSGNKGLKSLERVDPKIYHEKRKNVFYIHN